MTAATPSPRSAGEGALFRFGLWIGRHAKVVLIVGGVVLVIVGGVVLVIFGVVGAGAFGKLEAGGFEDPSSDSFRATSISNAHFPAAPNLVLVVTPDDGRLDSAASTAAGRALTKALAAQPQLTISHSYWSTPAPALAAKDRSSGLVLAVISGDQSQMVNRGAEISKEFSGEQHGVSVRAGGQAGVFGDINTYVSSSLVLAESIAVPVTLVLLLLVFGSVVAALLPLLIGTVAIVGTFFELSILASVTDVSVFAVNLTTALGLGLGIDYGLLLVARFREQLAAGVTVEDAVARTVATAGRTIAFSAAAVIAALSTLTLFPLYFLSSFGYAGIGVVLIAALGALILIPAALSLLGARVDAGRLPFAGMARGSASPFWGRVAGTVFRHPLRTAGPVLIALLVAAVPLLGIHFALPDETVLPTGAASRQVATVLDDQYPSQSTAVIDVVSSGPSTVAAARNAAALMGRVPGVVAVEAGTATSSTDAYQQLEVLTDVPSGTDQAKTLVRQLRSVLAGTSTTGAEITGIGFAGTAQARFLVGGPDASLTDTLAGIGRPLPLALLIIVITTFVLLFLFTGSVVQPIRALVVNGLSLSAAVGVVTWVFQDGHLLGLFGATVRPMDASMTVLLLCIAFGLSMDYEVFLASRITELHFAGADLQTAVTQGLARTGRIVTSAAVLLSVSFFAFTTSSVSMLQLFGFGAGLAVLIDATLIRGVLVPAVMRLLGPANFWAPAPLRVLHRKVGLSEV